MKRFNFFIWNFSLPKCGDHGIGETSISTMVQSWVHGVSLTILEFCYIPLNVLVFTGEVPKKRILCWKPTPARVLKLNMNGAMFNKI